MFPESPLYGGPEACHTSWVRVRLKVEDVAGSEETSCHDYEGGIYAALESEGGRCTHGAGAAVGFWPIPPLCEQVLEKNNRRVPLPRHPMCAAQWCGVGCSEAPEPGHPSQGGEINLGVVTSVSKSHSASHEGGPGCRDPFPGLLND